MTDCRASTSTTCFPILRSVSNGRHPFKDGNGRIGRLLIPLLLYQKGTLATPMFYLSEYLESHRDIYYARLRGISQDGDWMSWLEFFLDAIVEQAMNNTKRVRGILELYAPLCPIRDRQCRLRPTFRVLWDTSAESQ
jgi:hypothetical protein